MKYSIFKFKLSLILLISIFVVSLTPLVAVADTHGCLIKVVLLKNGQTFSSSTPQQLNNSDNYQLQITIWDNKQPLICTNDLHWRVGSQYRLTNPEPNEPNDASALEVRDQGVLTAAINVKKTIELQNLKAGLAYDFILGVAKDGQFQSNYRSVSVALKFQDGSGSPTPVPVPQGDYAPKNITVCKLGSTTATICWKTDKASNTEVEYGENSTGEKLVRFTNFSLTDHSAPLPGSGNPALKPNTTYKYRVRSSPNAATISTKSDEFSFTTKKADGTGGDTGNTNTPGTVPNTNTGANFNVDLDSDVGSFFNPLTARTVPEIIAGLIRILFVLIGIASVVIIIVSGFRMVLANGNEEQLTKAKKAITWAIIGLIVSLMSFSIVAIVQRLIQVGA